MKTKTSPQIVTPFRAELTKRIAAKIREFRADGTTGVSLACLMQCVNPPSHGLQGAPLGTNARYYYAETFRETVAALPVARGFILAE